MYEQATHLGAQMQKKGWCRVPRKRHLRIVCRLDRHEYDVFDAKVLKSGLSKQEYIRSCVLNKKITEKVDIDIFKLINELNHVGNNLNQIAHSLNGKKEVLEIEIHENQEMVKHVLELIDKEIRGDLSGDNENI